jgi:poly(3-hydroxybutyrate) depolymerase
LYSLVETKSLRRRVARASGVQHGTYGLLEQYVRSVWCLGLIWTVIGWCVLGPAVAAGQTPSAPEQPGEPGRLTVNPGTAATGTATLREGLQRLDSLYPGDSLLDEAYVYVPKRAIGKQRSPLLVMLHGDHMTGEEMLNESEGLFKTLADSNGIILLAPTSHSDDRGWGDMHATQPPNVDLPRINAALVQVLGHYAIDPKRVALLGESAGAGTALDLGYVNGDVFSGTIVFSGFAPFLQDHEFDGLKQHGTPNFFIEMNSDEAEALHMSEFVSWAKRAGISATFVQDSGPHRVFPQRGTAGFHWLTNSWP